MNEFHKSKLQETRLGPLNNLTKTAMDTLTQEGSASVERRCISEAPTSKTGRARSAMEIAEELEVTENEDKSINSIQK